MTERCAEWARCFVAQRTRGRSTVIDNQRLLVSARGGIIMLSLADVAVTIDDVRVQCSYVVVHDCADVRRDTAQIAVVHDTRRLPS